MHKVRVIPVLLLRGWGLEKSIQFTTPKYVGCPINAARVFNGKNVDELILLDIIATEERRGPQIEVVRQIAGESFMPFSVGGGIRTVDGMWELLQAGADRVVINTAAIEDPDLVARGADRFGRQCMVVSIDVRRHADGRCEVFTHAGRKATGLDPVETALRMEAHGAGEIFLTSIDRDGTMDGYDIELVRSVADAVSIPVIACGGAGSVAHLAQAVYEGHASAVAAGAFFLFYGKRRTVLITYPTDEELRAHFRPEHIRTKDPMSIVDTRLARL
ncbi:MAG TPA: AglZ/HisF2 family acetamidino modification protein [Candidatus Hydrogenedentes bacterium]|nr:AglZ/HisF2 family acetamidino modification protein [Candidatus Hydrogenedentota bacterium]HPC17374.1 AglZ/HisF2 family acetamidino modification protein [Candidatus Hydrogenedentota bacterium]HRT20108.1 AglZ/HisF2 family acetamidino modification protein [Candidatus Hydrogenedentota bacterium]HRT64828.1 AglZ/HisF2 family acetamidino modification protein [Candidatus Hydrogenedentota bacterium]